MVRPLGNQFSMVKNSYIDLHETLYFLLIEPAFLQSSCLLNLLLDCNLLNKCQLTKQDL